MTTMRSKIEELLKKVEEFKPKDFTEIEDFRIKILGKKGELASLFEEFKGVSADMKKELGQKINLLKNTAIDKINELKNSL